MPKTATVANKQRSIQSKQDAREKAKPKSKPAKKPAKVETGSHTHPGTPLPAKKLKKPGREADLAQKPQFLAPNYRGSGKLQGMRAIITGGDSGIGRAVAVLFAREGADVAIVYLNEHEDARATKKYVEQEGQRCILIPGDVKSAAFARKAVKTAVKEFGGLDILVNNAGFQEHADSIEDLTEERFDETLKTNVYGYFHMAKAVVPHLKRGSAIVNTGSVTGLKGSSKLIDYSTTKGAIHAFTMALAANLLEKGVRVNAVAPGPVWTPLNPADKPPKEIAEFGSKTDYHRPAQPEELSPAYVFLASAACSSYITGVVLPVTGYVGE